MLQRKAIKFDTFLCFPYEGRKIISFAVLNLRSLPYEYFLSLLTGMDDLIHDLDEMTI